MQEQTFELDPQGDMLLVLRRPNLQHLDWGQADSQEPRDDSSTDSQEPRDNARGIAEPESEHATDENEYSTDQDEDEEVRFRLSSRHPSLASPVFNTMLSGGWKESTISAQ